MDGWVGGSIWLISSCGGDYSDHSDGWIDGSNWLFSSCGGDYLEYSTAYLITVVEAREGRGRDVKACIVDELAHGTNRVALNDIPGCGVA